MKGASSILFFLLCLALLNFVSGNLIPEIFFEKFRIENELINKQISNGPYTPDWKSLDSRPLPEWYDDAKFGIMFHWGVYSVPSIGDEWFWYNWKTSHRGQVTKFMEKNYASSWQYQDFASQFRAELFDANYWIRLFYKAGAKYIAPTSKHHEGFCIWNSSVSWNWNSVNIGPHRDLLGELRDAVHAKNAELLEETDDKNPGSDIPIRFGLYHSLFEWYNPLYVQDKANRFQSNVFVDRKTMPELRDLIENYQPEYIFSDGDWEAPDTYWKSREFLAWVYNTAPTKDTIVLNDRWGKGTRCKHGDVWNCADRYNPGKLVQHKWENAFTIDRGSWSYSRTATIYEYLTIGEILEQFISTIARGGNVLLDVGPTADGRIAPIYEERLLQIGDFLNINGEAVYRSTVYNVSQRDTFDKNVYYTVPKALPANSRAVVYAFYLEWPSNNILTLQDVDISKYVSETGDVTGVNASLLGTSMVVKLTPRSKETGVQVHLPTLNPSKENKNLLNQAAWVIKFDFLSNTHVIALYYRSLVK